MALSEKAWQEQVIELATYYRWEHFHPFDMRRSDPGWPDLTLARAPLFEVPMIEVPPVGELVFAELKTDRGALTRRQRYWIELLRSCGQEVHVWRPRNFEAVHARLKRRHLTA
jgi:hypothetical protein